MGPYWSQLFYTLWRVQYFFNIVTHAINTYIVHIGVLDASSCNNSLSVVALFFPSTWLAVFFHFVLRFWNHVFTCCLFKPSCMDKYTLSAAERYFCFENLSSNISSCAVGNIVRAFRLWNHGLPSWGGLEKWYNGYE